MLRGGVACCGAARTVAVVVLRGFCSKVLDFLPVTIIQCIYIQPSCVCVGVFVKNGPEKCESVEPEGGIQCSAGFKRTVKGGLQSLHCRKNGLQT